MTCTNKIERNFSSNSVLDEALLDARTVLRCATADREFPHKMKLAFGENADVALAESLVRELAQSNSKLLPKIEICPAAEIEGAKARFSGQNDTIYLSREFLEEKAENRPAIVAVLLEEMGRAIDWQLHPQGEAKGEGGELFSALVRGTDLFLFLIWY